MFSYNSVGMGVVKCCVVLIITSWCRIGIVKIQQLFVRSGFLVSGEDLLNPTSQSEKGSG
jgi:hypothetical protein